MPRATAAEWPDYRYYAQPTAELKEQIVADIRAGLSIKLAAKRAFVRPGKVNEWLKQGAERLERIEERGEGHPGEIGLFFLEVEKAIGDRAYELVTAIKDAEKDVEWKPSSWLLERLEREDYAQRTEGDRGPVTIVVQSAFPGIAPVEVIEIPAADVRELEPGE